MHINAHLHEEIGQERCIFALVLANGLQLMLGLLDDVCQDHLTRRKHLEARLVELLGCLTVVNNRWCRQPSQSHPYIFCLTVICASRRS